MTYLELCKFVHRFCGSGDALPGTAPTTTVGQTGYLYEITQWVNDAYGDIQKEQSQWAFMNDTVNGQSLNSVSGASFSFLVAQIPDIDEVLPFKDRNGNRYITVYPLASGVSASTPVWYEDYSVWRGFRDRGTIPTGTPTSFTLAPDKSILLYPNAPNINYLLSFNYRRTVDVLSGDSATPIFPERYHDAIAWRAIWLWAIQRRELNMYEMAKREFETSMDQLRREQLPEMTFNQTLYFAP